MEPRRTATAAWVVSGLLVFFGCKSSATSPTPPAPQTQYTLTVTCSPSNGGTVTKSPDQAQYASGTAVTLTANPASGYQFTRWEGGATGTANPVSVTMNGNKNVTAVFSATAAQYTLTVTSSPSNGGTVTKSPDQAQYASGTSVTLTAVPASGYAFSYWAGDLSGSFNPSQVVMNGDKSMTAVFRDLTAALIQLSPTSLSFSATQGGAAPAAQTVSITNAGSSYLSNLYCTFPDGQPGWLTATLNGRTAPTTVTVQVVMTDPFGSPYGPGTYTTRIAISSAGASNSPQYVNVTLTIASPTDLTAYASYDNVVIMSTSIPSWANTVYSSTDLVVGYDFFENFGGYDYLTAVSLLKFNIQPQLAGRSIARATLRLHVYILRGDFSITPRIRLNALSTDWNPNTITWNIWQTMHHYLAGEVTLNAPSSGALPVDFDVTTIVRNWASGTFNNYGLQLFPEGHLYPWYSSLQATHFQSLETYNSLSMRPQLIIEFQ
jgi:hypothetical protein